jgi:hypothetical protein
MVLQYPSRDDSKWVCYRQQGAEGTANNEHPTEAAHLADWHSGFCVSLVRIPFTSSSCEACLISEWRLATFAVTFFSAKLRQTWRALNKSSGWKCICGCKYPVGTPYMILKFHLQQLLTCLGLAGNAARVHHTSSCGVNSVCREGTSSTAKS